MGMEQGCFALTYSCHSAISRRPAVCSALTLTTRYCSTIQTLVCLRGDVNSRGIVYPLFLQFSHNANANHYPSAQRHTYDFIVKRCQISFSPEELANASAKICARIKENCGKDHRGISFSLSLQDSRRGVKFRRAIFRRVYDYL